MAVRYHYERCQQTLANLRSPEYIPKMQQRFKQGSNPSWAEWRAWAQECGFTAVNMTPAPLGVLQTLQRHGATLYSGTWGATYDGHVVVLIGVNTDTSKLYIDDPLELNAPTEKDINTYFGTLTQRLWENPLFVYQG